MRLKTIKKHLSLIHPQESKAHILLDAFIGLFGPDFEPQDEMSFSRAILAFNDIPQRKLTEEELKYGLKVVEEMGEDEDDTFSTLEVKILREIYRIPMTRLDIIEAINEDSRDIRNTITKLQTRGYIHRNMCLYYLTYKGIKAVQSL